MSPRRGRACARWRARCSNLDGATQSRGLVFRLYVEEDVKFVDLEEYALLLGKPDWTAQVLARAAAVPELIDDARFLKSVGGRISQELKRDHAGVALRWAVLGLVLARQRVHPVCDALRPSTVRGREKKVLWVLEQLERVASNVPEVAHHSNAITSWRNFVELFLGSRSEKAQLESKLSRFPHRIARMALSLVEERLADENVHSPIRTGTPAAPAELGFQQACS